jgi:hypothetical protein
MKQFCLGIIVAIGLTLPAFGEEAGKLPDGVYVLNLAKSTVRGRSVKSQTLNVVGDTVTISGIGSDDRPYTFTGFNGIADGKPHAVTGISIWDAVTQTQLDPYTISISRQYQHQDVEPGCKNNGAH